MVKRRLNKIKNIFKVELKNIRRRSRTQRENKRDETSEDYAEDQSIESRKGTEDELELKLEEYKGHMNDCVAE